MEHNEEFVSFSRYNINRKRDKNDNEIFNTTRRSCYKECGMHSDQQPHQIFGNKHDWVKL